MRPDELERLSQVEASHFWFRARRRELGPWIRDAAREAPAGPLLDLGVGTGGNLGLLRSHAGGRGVIGIERSPAAISHCRLKAPEQPLLRATAGALPLRDSSIAIATALDLFEHLADDRGAALDLARCLAPSGHLIATVPSAMTPFSSHDVALGHHRRYRRGELEELLEFAGFEVLESRGFNLLLLPLIGGWRAVKALFPGSTSPRSDLHRLPILLDRTLGTILELESSLPYRLRGFGGVSWWVRARRRMQDG
jgi:SAM-dependent methyltransferase